MGHWFCLLPPGVPYTTRMVSQAGSAITVGPDTEKHPGRAWHQPEDPTDNLTLSGSNLKSILPFGAVQRRTQYKIVAAVAQIPNPHELHFVWPASTPQDPPPPAPCGVPESQGPVADANCSGSEGDTAPSHDPSLNLKRWGLDLKSRASDRPPRHAAASSCSAPLLSDAGPALRADPPARCGPPGRRRPALSLRSTRSTRPSPAELSESAQPRRTARGRARPADPNPSPGGP